MENKEFNGCFLFLDFKNSNLTNSKFISCNIKTADFRGANLKQTIVLEQSQGLMNLMKYSKIVMNAKELLTTFITSKNSHQ